MVRLTCLCLCYLILLHVGILAYRHGLTGEDEEENEEKEEERRRNGGCDRKFQYQVESCLEALKGFHVMTRHKTIILGDWARTDFICMFQLMQVAGLCLSSLYALSPQSRRWRSLCGFHGLDPELLLLYGQAVCRNKEVLKDNWECLNHSQAALQSCLYDFHARTPSRLSTGMWKEPLYSPHCSYHAYSEHCFEKHMFGRCSIDLYYAHLDILKSTVPPTCSWKDVDFLKRRFRETESYIVYYSSSDWTLRSVTLYLIGGIVFRFIATVEVLGVG